MEFPELTDWSSSSSLLQVKCLQKGRFLEATWFLINFYDDTWAIFGELSHI